MTSPEVATTAPTLAESLYSKLHDSASPLKLADAIKGIPRAKITTKAQQLDEMKAQLEEEVRLGRVFCQPSAKNGELRYWSRDERRILREKAIESTQQPKTIAVLKKELAKEVKGADGAFVETVLRELIADGKLFEHSSKTKSGGPKFANFPPPPPTPILEQPIHLRSLNTIANSCRKLLDRTGVSLDTLFETLRNRFDQTKATLAATVASPTDQMKPSHDPSIDDFILKAVAHESVLSLAELRREMPHEYQGSVFDDSVLRLVDRGKIIVTQDADPTGFTVEQRREYVLDGDKVYTNVMKRSG